MTTEHAARMGLAAAQDAGDAGLAKLVRQLGAVEVWRHLRSGRSQTAMAQRASQIDCSDLARQTEAIKARFVIPSDEQWPVLVGDLAWSELVGGFGGEPLGLWMIGHADLAQLGPSLAMVGSRASTTYGEHVAADWAAGVAERGYPVVSGGAYGIDSSAHRAAIAVSGQTVAVMAGGLARLYPVGNTSLLQAVQDHGVIVSEFPPDRPPSRSRFLVRNRLIAALARATVIVEAACRSGAHNTVSWALSLQRPVLAAPGPVTSALSVTPHRLIRSGEATLVTSVDEILAAVTPIDTGVPDYPHQQPTLFDSLSVEQRRVHEILPATRGACVDELSVLTGESAGSLMVCLAWLKQIGLAIETAPGIWCAQPGNRKEMK